MTIQTTMFQVVVHKLVYDLDHEDDVMQKTSRDSLITPDPVRRNILKELIELTIGITSRSSFPDLSKMIPLPCG